MRAAIIKREIDKGYLVVLNAIVIFTGGYAMQRTEKLSITLPADMVKQIRAKVSAGGYSSNSEVIREALRGWMNQECQMV